MYKPRTCSAKPKASKPGSEKDLRMEALGEFVFDTESMALLAVGRTQFEGLAGGVQWSQS